MNATRLKRILFALFLSIPALPGCQKPASDEWNPIELRTYDVPKGTVRPLMTTFKDGFWVDEKTAPIGRATTTPDGRLMVVARHNVQEGVQNLVDEITKHPPTGDPAIELRYWVILGRPAAAATPNPPVLRDVQAALDEITKTQGPQTFTVAEYVRLTSLHDEWGKEDGDTLHIEQNAVLMTDGVYASLEIKYAKNDRVSTRVRVALDQTVVLGATGQHDANADAGESATLYYLVRVAPRQDGQKP